MGQHNSNRYPALGRVLLVESRHGVRVKVIEALKSSLLFHDIIQPISLSDGISKMNSESFDACIVGSSVKRHKATEFVAAATEAVKGTDCALVALVKEGADEIPNLPGVHQSFQWPCTPEEFTEGVVEGVVTANPITPWAEIFEKTHPDFSRPKPAKHAAPASSSASDGPKSAPPVSPPAQQEASDSAKTSTYEVDLSPFLNGDTTDLDEIIIAVSKGELGLDEFGRPDRMAQFALARVTQRMFSGQDRSRKILEFKEYFAASLELWFIDVSHYGSALANTNLRNSLLAFTQA